MYNMSNQRIYHECEVCGTQYLIKEVADYCEKVCPIFVPVMETLVKDHSTRHRNSVGELIKFFNKFQEDNKLSNNPFQIESTKVGGLINYNEKLDLPLQERIIWDHINTLLEVGMIFRTNAGLECSIEFIQSLLDSFEKCFKPKKDKLEEQV